jgi:Arabinose efflux permease
MNNEPLFDKSAIAVAFATFVAFMGIGVVDPLLPLIAKDMGASAFDVEWLFTSYIAVMALAMLIAGWLSTNIGNRKTLILGLSTVVIFSTLSGISQNIPVFAIYRGFWGLGNALFTTTALSIIVGLSSRGNLIRSITLYEAALGLGISSGPLLGGILGSYNWRYPFFGTATLMAIGLILTISLIGEPPVKEQKRSPSDIFKALRDKGIITNALIALGYTMDSSQYLLILLYL